MLRDLLRIRSKINSLCVAVSNWINISIGEFESTFDMLLEADHFKENSLFAIRLLFYKTNLTAMVVTEYKRWNSISGWHKEMGHTNINELDNLDKNSTSTEKQIRKMPEGNGKNTIKSRQEETKVRSTCDYFGSKQDRTTASVPIMSKSASLSCLSADQIFSNENNLRELNATYTI